MKIFPSVTTSKEEFIEYIIMTCEAKNVEEEKKEQWVKKVRECLCSEGHYFYNMIFLHAIKADVILHELIHHIAKELKVRTLSSFWEILDNLDDVIDILIFKKGKLYLYWFELCNSA